MDTSSDEATHPDVTTLSDTETTTSSIMLPGGELSNQGDAPGSDPPLAVSEDSVPEPENFSEVKEVERVQDSADVEETVQGHEEQSDGKADSELASPVAKNESPTASTLEAQAEPVEVDTETANSDIKPDTDMTIESSKPFKPAHSLPPHMRPDFQSSLSRHFGVHDSRPMVPPNEVTRFNEGPRAPRSHYTSYQPRGDHGDREQFVRISAQLTKTKHELDVERDKIRRLRTTIEAEQQQKFEAASSSMLSNLLREQAEALTLKAKVEARERELDAREQKISQHEMYLSEGQKQLYHSLEKQGVRLMSAVDMQRARQEAELNAQKTMADINGKLNIKFEGLRLREAAQQMREQQYKAIIRDSLKSELENSLTDEKAEEIAELEYNNGYGTGKEIGRKEGHEKSRQRGFLEGYGACHRAQVTLSKFRQGLIDRNSPELDFLYDASHPHNLWNIGELVGRLQHEDDVERMQNVEKKEVATEKKPIVNTRADNVADETRNVDVKVNGYTNGTMVHKREEPVSRMPPARPTFAAELRGPSATHNGQIILANSAASLVVEETERPIIKNEEPVANLIDFM